MALEGANLASNVNTTEMPTTTETTTTTIAKEVATPSDTTFAPNMNTIQTTNMETPINVEVSTSSYADSRITPNAHAMESMINTTKTPIAMELSTSSEVDTRMMMDGSSSVAMLKAMVDERVESRECKSPSSMDTESFEQAILGQSVVRVENYIQEENAGNSPLLQDDMFSLAELSVVENQQLDEATTVCSADIVTSASDHCYESLLGSGQLATSISGSGENCENDMQGVTKVTESVESQMLMENTIEKGNIKQNVEEVIGHTKVEDATNGSIGNSENGSKCIDHISNAGVASTGHDGHVKDDTNNIPNLATATTYVVDHDSKIENGHLLPLEVSDVANANIDGKDERESVHGNQVTLSKSQPELVIVKEMNDTYSTQAERAEMKKEQEFERASIKQEESCQENLTERILCEKQAELEVNPQSEDKKPEEIGILISGLAVSINEGTINMDIDHPSQGPSEELMQSKDMPQESVNIKEEIGPQELSQNVMMLEKDGQQLQRIPELVPFKKQQVCKEFGRKKYMGEVIGYDPTTKWFKVVYEDGDEEEVEKNELDSILLSPDENLVVSRKRRLPTDDDGHEDTNRTGRKLKKLNMQATTKKQGKSKTIGNEITGSNRSSSTTKKRKPSAVKSGGKGKSPKVSVPKTQKSKSRLTAAKKSIEKEKSEKKSQSTKSKKKPNNQMKQSSSKKAMVVAQNENQSVTRKLKYGSASKKTSTKANQKAKDIPATDKEEKIPQLSITENSAVATSSRKRKAGDDVQGQASMVSGKRTRREMVNDVETPPLMKTRREMVNDVETPPLMKTRREMVNNVETPPLMKTESKRRRIPEDGTEADLQVIAENNDTNDDSIPLLTGNRHVRSDKGSVLIGRKVRKDFGGSLYGGEIVGYKMYYNVKYDDGDTEDLNWKELEAILLPEEGCSSQPKHGKHNTENKVNSVKSKPKKKN